MEVQIPELPQPNQRILPSNQSQARDGSATGAGEDAAEVKHCSGQGGNACVGSAAAVRDGAWRRDGSAREVEVEEAVSRADDVGDFGSPIKMNGPHHISIVP